MTILLKMNLKYETVTEYGSGYVRTVRPATHHHCGLIATCRCCCHFFVVMPSDDVTLLIARGDDGQTSCGEMTREQLHEVKRVDVR